MAMYWTSLDRTHHCCWEEFNFNCNLYSIFYYSETKGRTTYKIKKLDNNINKNKNINKVSHCTRDTSEEQLCTLQFNANKAFHIN